jgi:hypothetical protein
VVGQRIEVGVVLEQAVYYKDLLKSQLAQHIQLQLVAVVLLEHQEDLLQAVAIALFLVQV